MAVKCGGISHVIIPDENARELKEIPENIYEGVEIHPIRWIDEVLKLSLLDQPKALVSKVDEAKPPNDSKVKQDSNEASHHSNLIICAI